MTIVLPQLCLNLCVVVLVRRDEQNHPMQHIATCCRAFAASQDVQLLVSREMLLQWSKRLTMNADKVNVASCQDTMSLSLGQHIFTLAFFVELSLRLVAFRLAFFCVEEPLH